MCASIFKKHTTQRYIYILLFFCALFVVVFYPSLRSSFLFRQSCALPLVGYNKHATRLNHWETDDILHAPMTILCQQTKHTHTHTHATAKSASTGDAHCDGVQQCSLFFYSYFFIYFYVCLFFCVCFCSFCCRLFPNEGNTQHQTRSSAVAAAKNGVKIPFYFCELCPRRRERAATNK